MYLSLKIVLKLLFGFMLRDSADGMFDTELSVLIAVLILSLILSFALQLISKPIMTD